MKKNDRSGFTLIELLVVAVLGGLLMTAIYQTLIANQRTYALQEGQTDNMRKLRTGMAVLAGELREVSGRGGDILGMSEDTIRFRTMEKFGLACTVTAGATLQMRVMKVGRAFEVGDSVFVFADGDTTTANDDTWGLGAVTAADPTVNCAATGDAATDVTVSGFAGAATTDVFMGAPVRSFENVTYRFYGGTQTGYLYRRDSTGSLWTMIGPLLGDTADGFSLAFYDSTGAGTTEPDSVRQIAIQFAAASYVRDDEGNRLSDTLETRVFVRN